MKKTFAILLALIMVLSLATTAFAADSTLTINTVNGHTYKVYQLLAGDVSSLADGSGTLSNVTAGAHLKAGTDLDAFVAAISGKTGAELSKIAYTYLDTTAPATAEIVGDGTAKNATIADGYYIVLDSFTGEAIDGDALSRYMVAVVGDTTMTPKTGTVTSEKKVQDINDSNNAGVDVWQDSADHDIGDEIPFKLTANLPANVSDYTTYYLKFNDTMTNLTYKDKSAVVKVNGTPVASGYTVNYDAAAKKLTVEFTDVKAAPVNAGNGAVITVEYIATLDSTANIGAAGNPNVMYVEYSNNPNGEGKGETAEDKVTVFTFKLTVNKVDSANNALAGAGFTLYKYDATATDWVAVGAEITGVTEFNWNGLDDGNYKLVESTTPVGYNTIAPIEFTITAEHEVLSADPQLTKLEGGSLVSGEFKGTGVILTNVVNNQGSVLPSTGGIGTTLFYVFGSMMVVGAAVVLVTKKRMGAAE